MNRPISQDLFTIFTLLRAIQPSASKTETYKRMARRLSKIAGENQPWSWRYIQSVMTGTVYPSAQLTRAISLLAAAIDGQPPEFAEAVELQVVADPARVQAGSLVLGQTKQCEDPGCTIVFVPVVPWGKYCPAHKRR